MGAGSARNWTATQSGKVKLSDANLLRKADLAGTTLLRVMSASDHQGARNVHSGQMNG